MKFFTFVILTLITSIFASQALSFSRNFAEKKSARTKSEKKVVSTSTQCSDSGKVLLVSSSSKVIILSELTL
jgi:hypothetical protein